MRYVIMECDICKAQKDEVKDCEELASWKEIGISIDRKFSATRDVCLPCWSKVKKDFSKMFGGLVYDCLADWQHDNT